VKYLPVFLVVICSVVVVTKADAAAAVLAGDNEEMREMKRLMVEVEQIHRLEPKERQRKVERLYRTLLPRIWELDWFSLTDPEPPIFKGRDKLSPEQWVEKAWSLDASAFMYLLGEIHRTGYHVLNKHRAELRPLVLADLVSAKEKEVKWALHIISQLRPADEFFDAVLAVFEKNAVCSDAAGVTLRDIDDPRAIVALVNRDPNLVGVGGHIRHLQRKRKADPAVVRLLDAKDAEVRGRAAYALAESGDPALLGRIEKLVKDANPRVRLNAANMGFCMEKTAYRQIRPALVLLMTDPDPDVKKFVRAALAYRQDPDYAKKLLDMVRYTNLGQREHGDVVALISAMAGTNFGYDGSDTGWRPTTTKNQAAIARFAAWVEQLRPDLDNEDPFTPEMRQSLAKINKVHAGMKKEAIDAALDELYKDLKRVEPKIFVAAAIGALMRVAPKDPRTRKVLRDGLANGWLEPNLAHAMLVKAGDDPELHIKALIENIGAADAKTRRAALRAIGDCGPRAKEALPVLRKIIDDANAPASDYQRAFQRIDDVPEHVLAYWAKTLIEAGRLNPKEIKEFVADPINQQPDYFKDFKIAQKDLEIILQDYYLVEEGHWKHGYSHVAFGDRTGHVILKDGKKVNWMVRPGGLAWLKLESGKKLYLAREWTDEDWTRFLGKQSETAPGWDPQLFAGASMFESSSAFQKYLFGANAVVIGKLTSWDGEKGSVRIEKNLQGKAEKEVGFVHGGGIAQASAGDKVIVVLREDKGTIRLQSFCGASGLYRYSGDLQKVIETLLAAKK
jgi:HEAT repeat protein